MPGLSLNATPSCDCSDEVHHVPPMNQLEVEFIASVNGRVRVVSVRVWKQTSSIHQPSPRVSVLLL